MQKRLITILVAGFVMVALTTSAWGACKAEVITSVKYLKAGVANTGGVVGGPTADPAPPNVDQASHQVSPTAAVAPAPHINREGRTERVADVLVWDDGLTPGATSCFNTTNTIRLTYNTSLTSPASVSAATTANFDVFDSASATSSGLVISAASTVGLAPGGTPQTVITVTILQKGTDTGDITTGDVGSGFRIKNLRVDASSLADGGAANVTVSQNTGLITTVGPNNLVGTAHNSFSGGAVTTPGVGIQNAGGGLSTQAVFSFSEGFQTMMRVAGGSCSSTTLTSDTCLSQVANDVATNATDIVFDAGTTLPSGVSVTWPTTISTSNVAGTGSMILTLANTPTCGGGSASPCFAIYSTTKGDGGAIATLEMTTVAGSTPVGVQPVCGATPLPACPADPQIGVQIAATSGAGTVTLHSFMGPAEASGSTDDDVNASAVPRYITFNGKPTGSAASRNIIGGGSTATTWFTIGSNKTVILYPYVTNLFGYQTGIVVSNTSNDSTIYGSKALTPQKGGLKFYFFPTNGTPFTLNTDVTTGGVGNVTGTRGLDTNGQLSGGSVFAASIGSLLTAAGQPAGASFDGYIIVVASFQFAHGQVAVISPNGTAAYSDVGILADVSAGRTARETLEF